MAYQEEPKARPAVSPSTSCVISNHSRSDIDAQMSKWYPYYTGPANRIQLVISVRYYCDGQIHPCEGFVLEERLQKFFNYFTVSYGDISQDPGVVDGEDSSRNAARFRDASAANAVNTNDSSCTAGVSGNFACLCGVVYVAEGILL